ncbi:UbiA family prenyltransferase [Streptomyces violens]|uniref:UbiA family prenyltransferase n=1 Tax=Streptomyces violens TaxID=66377 RepID=UPI0004BFA2AE|nr:UbiA family prenyltransferase [Streptomyces violens]
MSSEVELPAGVRPAPATAKVRAYVRLAKLDIIDYYLALPVALTLLLATGQRLSPGTLLTLVLFGLGELCVIAASVAFDDVTGYRDGSDAANYGPDAPRRRLARKPLLAGTLTPTEAIRFGWAAAVAGALLWAGAAAVAPHRSAWTLVLAAACLVTAVQYSWGLKISYRGWQEVFLCGFGVGMVLVPYGLLSASLSGFAVVQAVLFGAGPMLFGLYSNTHDIEGDARVGRPTVAVLTSPRGNALFITAMTLAQVGLVVWSAVAGVAPWWFPLAMLPMIALRGTELDIAFRRRDILLARRTAIRNHRVTVVLLCAVNVALPLLPGSTP